MKNEEQFNFEEIRKKALEQFRSGKSLCGKDGALAPMLKSFLEAALDAHLDVDERKEGNRKNGKTSKTLQTSDGPLEIETGRDRNSTFEPELVKERESVLADTLESKIIGLYGLGMSFRESVKILGAEIKVTSKLGEGTSFTIELPNLLSLNKEETQSTLFQTTQ